MNVIVVVLQTSNATYRNSCEAHVFCRLRHVQRALDHLHMWNTSRDMDDLVNEGSLDKRRCDWKEAREA